MKSFSNKTWALWPCLLFVTALHYGQGFIQTFTYLGGSKSDLGTQMVVGKTTANVACTYTTFATTALCHANATPEDATDDYMTFSIHVSTTPMSTNKFTVTATQGGNPLAVTLSNGSAATSVNCGLNTPLRTPAGSAGKGNVTLTITDNVTGCSTTVVVTDPGTCAVTCVQGTPSTVVYQYATQMDITELNSLPIMIPKFDEQGGTRVLQSVKLEYTVGGKTAFVFENRAAQSQSFNAKASSEATLTLNSTDIATNTLEMAIPQTTLPGGVLVPATGSWAGDSIPSPTPTPTTLGRMESWVSDYLTVFKDPRTDARWVTNATGDATDDDDMYLNPMIADSASGTFTYNTALALAPFIGTGNVPLEVSTLSGLALTGGGGNLIYIQRTRAYASAKVTYTFECILCTKPVALATPKTQTICAGGAATAFTATPSTGVQYKWYGPLADTTSSLGTAVSGATSATFTPSGAALTTAGTKYYAVVVNTTGDLTCADTAYVQLVVNAKPVLADGSATICAGESVDLISKITNYNSYQGQVWTVGTAGGTAVATPSSVKPTGTTTYVLVAQNAAGCKDTANVVVTVNAKPNAGKDTTLACVNAATNTLATSYTLVPSPAGGTWAQLGTTPTTATISGNNVTGMSIAGTYQFIYTTTAGCKDTVAVTVAPCAGCVKPNAGADAANVCQPMKTAKLTAVTTGGTWAPIGVNPSAATIDASGNISGLNAAGTYKFVYSITSGGQTCTDTAQVVVLAKPVIADGSATICAGESVDLISKITNYNSYQGQVWTVGTAGGTVVATPTSVKPMGTTTYVLVAQNAAGCKDTANVVVTVNPKPSAGKDTTLACVNAANNTLAMSYTLVPSPTGGTWAQLGTPPTTATITGNNVTGMTVTGTYQFIYTTTAGCKDTVAVTVAPCAGCVKPNAGADAANVCQPMKTAKLTAVTTGGTWAPIGSPANPSAATIDASGNISGLNAAGTYKFVYSITSGGQTCTDTAQVVVLAKPTIADGSATICAGESVDLISKITNYNSYQGQVWTVGTAGGTVVATPTSVKPMGTTTYVLVAQNAAGCKDTANVVVTVNAKPNAGKDTTLACVNAATNTLATSYTLVPSPAGGTWAQLGTTPTTATITGNNVTGMSVAGTYQFIYTTTAGCKDTVAVTVAPCAGCVKPNAGADAANVCQPTSTAKLTAVTTGGTWAPIVSPANPSAATIDASGNVSGLNAAGTYKFVYSITSGGQTCTDTAQVIVLAKPTIADGSATICAGESVDLTSKITNYNTYLSPLWTIGTAGGTAVATPSSLKPTGTTTYLLVAQNAAGCKDTANVVVTVNAKPNAGKDTTLACVNAGTNTLATSYTLVPSPSGGSWSQLGTTPTTATISGNNVTGMSVAGTYQFIYTTTAGCKDTVAVTVAPCAGCVKPNAGADAANVCKPTSTAKLTAVTAGGTWAPIGSPANPSAATIDASGNISGLNAAGTYKFVYSVTSGGQTCTDTAQVIVLAKPVIADGSATICAGESVDLITKITNYNSYQGQAWTIGAAGGTAVATPSAVKPTGTTTYVLVAQNAAGCKDTANVVVTVNAKPNAGKDTTLACVNAATNTLATSYTLVPSPAGGTWAQLGTTPTVATISGNNVTGMSIAGTYQFIYTTTAGCKDTVAVTVAPCAGCVKPNAGADAANVCQPMKTAKLTAVTTGGTWAPIGSPANPSAATIDASGNISGLNAAGTYKFVYSITSGGQTCTDTAQVVVLAKPTIADGSATICAGESVDLISKITNYNSYQGQVWTVSTAGGTVVTTPSSVKPTGTTTYVLVAQNAAGCKDTANVVVTVNAKPSVGKDTTLVCSNGNVPSSVQLSATPTGGTWSALTRNPTGATVNSSGLVSITNATAQGKSFDFVYSLNGCQDTVKVIVPVCQQPCVKSSISSAAPVCSNDAQTYSFTFTVANKLGTIKVNKGTLSGNNPYTVSGIPSGQNVIITDSLSAICKSDTIIAGVNCNCNPALPKLITSSFTVCIGDTFPTLKATVVGLATVEWFSQQTGSAVLFTGLN